MFQIILELCRNEETASILCVQPHLEQIHTGVSEGSVYILLITISPPKKQKWQHISWPASNVDSDGVFQSGDAEVDAEETIFVELIQTLLKDPAEREHFYEARQTCVTTLTFWVESLFILLFPVMLDL